MTKMTAKAPQQFKPKPGSLKATHIEYGVGDSASVHHEHHPDPGKNKEPWGEPPPLKKHFTSRMEAHHHAAEMANVPSTIDDENEANDEDDAMYPQGQPEKKPVGKKNPPAITEAGGSPV